MKRSTCGAVVFGLLCSVAVAHMKIISPTPRDPADDQTTGPCGNINGQFGGTVTELTPGQIHNVVLNANEHGGFYRVALSQVGSDTYDCVLIDHVPQHKGTANAETIPLVVPDVDCQNCALQVYMVAPSGTCCDKSAGACGTAWYSCSNVKINGKTPRDKLKCAPPCTWAYRDEQPGVYSTGNNNAVWISEGNTNYRLNVSGGYYTPKCPAGSPAERTECVETTTEVSSEDGESKSSNSLTDGGKMSAGGVIGIIVVILVLIGIGITWFVAVKNKKPESKPFSPMMVHSSQQAIVQVDGEPTTTTTRPPVQTRPPMPPLPPQRV